jgi:hypothetical protein
MLGNIKLRRCGGIRNPTRPISNNGNGVIDITPFAASTLVLIAIAFINKVQLPRKAIAAFCLLI